MTLSCTQEDALRQLQEADAMLREGVRRIMSASSDLPTASHPLEEALRLTEKQAMATLEAVEGAFVELEAIRAMRGGFIDGHLDTLESQLHMILASQQGQDLAGQRLKKAISLLQAVEDRIGGALGELGFDDIEPLHAGKQMAAIEDDGGPIGQDDVDALLKELGI